MLRNGLTRNLLIFLGFIIDEVDANTFSAQMQRMYCQGWYKRSSFESTFRKMLSVGEIEKIQKGGKVYYRLTSRGNRKLVENVPILKLSQKPWDQKWRIVIFDINEKDRKTRTALRVKLLSLGFGMWQESVYITPFNIEQEINQFLISKHIFPNAVCLVAQRSALGDDRVLAEKVWKLEELNDEYKEIASQCVSLEKNDENIEKYREIWLNYQDIILKDPYLPEELLPSPWYADKAKKSLLSWWNK